MARISQIAVQEGCFTLTMWDVKAFLPSELFHVFPCFTLTMWDVKACSEYWSIKKASWFYLNYVGCKGKMYQDTKTQIFRFTLTMWDVK